MKREGNKRASHKTDTKKEALITGRACAKQEGAELVTWGANS